MPKVKSMLKRIEVEVAERQRKCRHTGGIIVRGDSCLVIFDGYRDRHCYSRDVALRMIASARQVLDGIESQFG